MRPALVLVFALAPLSALADATPPTQENPKPKVEDKPKVGKRPPKVGITRQPDRVGTVATPDPPPKAEPPAKPPEVKQGTMQEEPEGTTREAPLQHPIGRKAQKPASDDTPPAKKDRPAHGAPPKP